MFTQSAPQPARKDPVQVDPNHYTIELENNRVRVLRIRYGLGEKSLMHGHPRTVADFLNPAQCQCTYADGGTEETSSQPAR
jgi:hypothetical protein